MKQISPYSLWIGGVGDLRDWRALYERGIRAVVQVAYEETLVPLPHDFVVCRFPLVDGDDNAPEVLALAVDTLVRFVKANVPCLVCCQAGLSRSPTLVAAALARVTGQTLVDCVASMAAQHACSIHPGFLASLLSLNGDSAYNELL